MNVEEVVSNKKNIIDQNIITYLKGYADGINYWAALNPNKVDQSIFPVSENDLLVGMVFRMPLFYGFDHYIEELIDLLSDEDLKTFNFYKDDKKIIKVILSIQNIEEIQKIINEVKLSKFNFDTFTIKYSFVNGWDVKTDKFLIRFGKDLSKDKFKKFQDTSNYLYENTKIPSIIDMRYRDGVAINYGK